MPSTSLDKGFRAHYNAGVEKNRLLSGSSNLEFERTKQIILRHLPKRPSVIVDVGGGPGRYSFWLAEMGHAVHLIDVLPLHIRQAKRFQKDAKRPLASIALGDARNLEFEDGSVDRFSDVWTNVSSGPKGRTFEGLVRSTPCTKIQWSSIRCRDLQIRLIA